MMCCLVWCIVISYSCFSLLPVDLKIRVKHC
uniref:Uncharacterized protein n=1 Tax=Arundo donax TaxID=35708 RepID=A0A0A8XZU7_ARUDO